MLIKPDQNRTALLAVSLRTVAGVVLLSALGLAPLDYGSTRLVPFETLIALSTTGGIAWLLSSLLGHAWVLPPAIARLGLLLIAVSAAAWLLALVPPDWPAFTRQHYARVAARWPYSVVPRNFSLVLLWSAAVLLAFVALHDLVCDPVWRRSTAAVMLLTGAAVALLGLLQNATRARGIYWDASQRLPGAFFGPFFHHTSAGAYLNTVWPLGFGLALGVLRNERDTPRARIFIYASLFGATLVLAAHGGHVSRLPQVLMVLALVGLAFWIGLWRTLGEIRGLRRLVFAGAAAIGLAVLVLGASRFDVILSRWHGLVAGGTHPGAAAPAVAPEDWPRVMRDDLFVPSDHRAYFLGDRGAAYAAAIDAIRGRPWFGWGPGGWTAAAAAHSGDAFIRTFYLYLQFTHSDPLQAAVEWGLIGALGWTLLLPGAVVWTGVQLGRRPARDPIAATAAVGLAAVLVQSLVDFPLQIPAVHFNALALAALAWSVAPLANPFPSHERLQSH